nr:protealysin inhibitor emfourin [uncultured Methanoregula sp.]
MLIRKWVIICSVVLLIALVFSGCLWVKTPVVSQTAPPSIFVDYHRTGGIAGLGDRLVLFDNGAGIISGRTRNTEITLNQTDLDRISTLFDQAQFSMLEGNYTSRHGSADLIQYSISYHGKTVKTEDSATPPALQPVIDELNRIVSQSERASLIPALSRIPT